ncbi:putative urea transporter [Serpula lacrymans var. lacrymans S7.9]|uniref:Putative urea transporter n=1 Tax=Serpula lacrymans var. lacrymans (strain S7.9) TaxID=578457 RepID=F8P325_SERL9|nr:putative urea transporter [Serpula lacrymans var. lacrymans S7.9]EGO22556.1 putative urea transporter [Serpula lacrymans var. lacrymans S7.9]
MLVLTSLQSKFSRFAPSSSEEFTSASRSVKPGLVCCGIVSAWTWSATLLQSSTVAYTLGVSGPWWYGAGGSIQVAMFGMVAAKVKMNANGAHTFLEIVKARFGTATHLLFTVYAFICILVVCGSLLLGGAATVNALTGMNTIAACFLLPIGIAVYVVFGGLRATFICDWTHTIILFIIIYIFLFRAFGTSPEIGSVPRMYELLVQAAVDTPVSGNENGSYLTLKSNQGLVFGAASLLSGFAGVFCDQASHPSGTTKAYMLGGISWFAVPWAFGSCLGLSARALQTNPLFPTYPAPLSAEQTSAGLAAAAAASVLMGKGGAIALLLVVFMAVTSAASSELIAVSSIVIYRTYWRPQATGAEIVRVSHYFICIWAIWMGCWGTIVSCLNKANIDLGWVRYTVIFAVMTANCSLGVVLSSAVIPIVLTVLWSKLTRAGVLCGSVIGACLGMLAWMIGCWKIYGTINITNLAEPYSAVCSGLTGVLTSGLITVFVSLMRPSKYDFAGTRAIALLDAPSGGIVSDLEKLGPDLDTKSRVCISAEAVVENSPSRDVLQQIFQRAAWYSFAMSAIVIIVVPIPMFFSRYIFSERFFAFWVACSIVWVFLSGSFCIILPLWESRVEMTAIMSEGFMSLKNLVYSRSNK